MVVEAVGANVNIPPNAGLRETVAPGVKATIASYNVVVVVLPETVRLVLACNTVNEPTAATD